MRPWERLRRLTNLREQLEETFTELLYEPWHRAAADDDWHPAIDIYETADSYLIEADLPGVRPADVRIELRGRWLTICGSRQSGEAQKNEQGVHRERTCGTFCRTFVLDHPVDATTIETRHEHGIYYLRIRKK